MLYTTDEDWAQKFLKKTSVCKSDNRFIRSKKWNMHYFAEFGVGQGTGRLH